MKIADAINRFSKSQNLSIGSDPTASEGDRADGLCRLLTDSVAVESWKDNGGDLGQIVYAGIGKLLIRYTESAHFKIARLLQVLQDDH